MTGRRPVPNRTSAAAGINRDAPVRPATQGENFISTKTAQPDTDRIRANEPLAVSDTGEGSDRPVLYLPRRLRCCCIDAALGK
jgi:hypothetical protein